MADYTWVHDVTAAFDPPTFGPRATPWQVMAVFGWGVRARPGGARRW